MIKFRRRENDGVSMKEGYAILHLLRHSDKRFKYQVDFVSEFAFAIRPEWVREGESKARFQVLGTQDPTILQISRSSITNPTRGGTGFRCVPAKEAAKETSSSTLCWIYRIPHCP